MFSSFDLRNVTYDLVSFNIWYQVIMLYQVLNDLGACKYFDI